MTKKFLAGNRNLLSGVVFAALANISVMAFSLLVIALAARTLLKEEIGLYFFALVVLQFASTLGDPGLRSAATRYISMALANGEEPRARFFFGAGFAASLVAALFLVLFSLSASEKLPIFHEVELLAQLVFLVVATINYQMASAILAGFRFYGVMSAANFVAEFIRFLLSLYVLHAGLGVAGLITAMAISKVLGIFLCFIRAGKILTSSSKDAPWKEILKFSGWSYGSSVVSIVQARSAEFVLTSSLGPVALANYSTAFQLPSALQRIVEAVRPVLLSHVAGGAKAVTGISSELFRQICGLSALVSVLLLAFSDLIFCGIFGSQFRESLIVFQIFAVWVALTSINYLLLIFLLGRGDGRSVFVQSLPQAAVMIIAVVVLTFYLQELGAAIAMLVSALVAVCTALMLMQKQGQDNVGGHWGWFARCCLVLSFSLAAAFYSKGYHFPVWAVAPCGVALIFLCGLCRFSDCSSALKLMRKK